MLASVYFWIISPKDMQPGTEEHLKSQKRNYKKRLEREKREEAMKQKGLRVEEKRK